QILQRVISLIIETYQGDLNSGSIFTYQEAKKREQPAIVISQEFIEKKIGQTFPEQVIEKIWQQLGFLYQKEGNNYHVVVPPYRPDITSVEDLLEEILRVYDYNKISNSSPAEFRTN